MQCYVMWWACLEQGRAKQSKVVCCLFSHSTAGIELATRAVFWSHKFSLKTLREFMCVTATVTVSSRFECERMDARKYVKGFHDSCCQNFYEGFLVFNTVLHNYDLQLVHSTTSLSILIGTSTPCRFRYLHLLDALWIPAVMHDLPLLLLNK